MRVFTYLNSNKFRFFTGILCSTLSGTFIYKNYSVYTSQQSESDRYSECLSKLHDYNESLKLKSEEDQLITISNSPDLSISHYAHASNSYHTGETPLAVFYPKNTEEVSEFVKLCNSLNLPIIAYGAGTNLEGSVVPLTKGVMIDFQKMQHIKEVYKEDFQVNVEPGVQWMSLNAELDKYDLFFPMDPGPGASIGGMINTNCSGTNAVRYGTMKDWIVNLTVVLSDGRIIKTGNRAKKSSAGYNLNSLFCGSEGTLGIVTEATLKVVPLEREYAVLNVCFEDINDAISSSIEIIQSGIQPSGLEFMDDDQVKAINYSSNYNLSEKHCLLVKFHGSDLMRRENIEKILKITNKYRGQEPKYALNKEEASIIWDLRKKALWSTQKLRKDSKIYITDVCVPISKLGISIKEVKEDIKREQIKATIVGHVGDGNYHLFINIDPNDKDEFSRVEALHQRMVKRVLELDGTCSGEHGIGIGKREYLLLEKSEDTIKLMKDIKKLIDPKGLQGKVFFFNE